MVADFTKGPIPGLTDEYLAKGLSASRTDLSSCAKTEADKRNCSAAFLPRLFHEAKALSQTPDILSAGRAAAASMNVNTGGAVPWKSAHSR